MCSWDSIKQVRLIPLAGFFLSLRTWIFAALLTAPLPSQSAPQYPMQRIAVTGGYCSCVAVEGDLLAYNQSMTLILADVTQPDQPLELGRLELPFPPEKFVLHRGYLYACQYEDPLGTRLVAVDARIPSEPRIASQTVWPNLLYRQKAPHDLVAEGDRLYVYVMALGLVALDISDPRNLRQLGNVQWDEYDYITVSQGIGFTSPSDGLQAYDLSDMQKPRLLFEMGLWFGGDVEMDGNILWINQGNALVTMDVGNPISRTQISSSFLACTPRSFTRCGDILLLASNAFSPTTLFCVDTSNPSSPTLMCQWRLKHPFPVSIAGNERAAFLTDSNTLWSIKLPPTREKYCNNLIEGPGDIRDFELTCDGRLAIIRDSDFQLYDIASHPDPQLLYSVPLPHIGEAVQARLRVAPHIIIEENQIAIWTVISSEVAGTPQSTALSILHCSGPTSATLAFSEHRSGFTADGAVHYGGHLYLLDGASLEVYDLSSATDPLVRSLPLNPPSYSIAQFDHYLYCPQSLQGPANCRVLDIADPTNPVAVNETKWAGASDSYSCLSGVRRLSRWTGGYSIAVSDFSDPLNPIISTRYDLLYSYTAAQEGDHAVCMSHSKHNIFGYGTLSYLDIATTGPEPNILGTYHIGIEAAKIRLRNQTAYMLDSEADRIITVDLSEPQDYLRRDDEALLTLIGIPNQIAIHDERLLFSVGKPGIPAVNIGQDLPFLERPLSLESASDSFAIVGDRLFSLDEADDTVSIIDLANWPQYEEFRFQVDFGNIIRLHPDGNRLWIASESPPVFGYELIESQRLPQRRDPRNANQPVVSELKMWNGSGWAVSKGGDKLLRMMSTEFPDLTVTGTFKSTSLFSSIELLPDSAVVTFWDKGRFYLNRFLEDNPSTASQQILLPPSVGKIVTTTTVGSRCFFGNALGKVGVVDFATEPPSLFVDRSEWNRPIVGIAVTADRFYAVDDIGRILTYEHGARVGEEAGLFILKCSDHFRPSISPSPHRPYCVQTRRMAVLWRMSSTSCSPSHRAPGKPDRSLRAPQNSVRYGAPPRSAGRTLSSPS